ncbi:MAG: flagellar assembly protein FliW [Vicinamibacterales bacterium]
MTDLMAPQRIVTFPQGLPGFEASRQFVLLASATLAPFTLLQGAGPEAPAFVAIDPLLVDPDYSSRLGSEDLARLQAAPEAPLLWLALVASAPDGSATVNLRAPIVINPASMRGIQLLCRDSQYGLTHPLGAG